MFFLVCQDVLEEFAADIVARLLAMGDRLLVEGVAGIFELQVAFHAFDDVLADQQLVEILQVGQALKKQDALDQLVGMFHLVDRFVIFDLAELGEAPVPEHARMQEILVDGRQFELQRLVEIFDDLAVAAHVPLLVTFDAAWSSGARAASNAIRKIRTAPTSCK